MRIVTRSRVLRRFCQSGESTEVQPQWLWFRFRQLMVFASEDPALSFR